MTERMLQKARRGDADAFIALCAPFEGLVYRHCLQMLKTQADAQDAAQETMLRAFRSFPSYEERSELGTWLFRIAHNVCLDSIKRAHNRYETASLDAMHEAGFDPATGSPTPEDAYLQKSEQEELGDAMKTLPDREQALLSLRYGDGMSYLQIAKVMRLPLGTVKSALSRAKDDLRSVVEKLKS
ncbi:MAG TPA: sigma-70 family RNA polymerase sigma factor [Candidatus Limiplasma sp.]|nr:sigma-70 family RNA polymerase sigma factor [Candidatus Limiplasma sp.]HRX09083.1 sigma-70 family RNA polymerase sigma factor [Candidatus Limiplasma sp.]